MDGGFPHSDRAHALLSASGAARWMACPGSVRLSKDIPETTSPFAEEGTKAHELAEYVLREGSAPGDADPEMLAYVQTYVDYVHEVRGNGHLSIESRVFFDAYVPEGFGTADAVVTSQDGHDLHVIDLKYGKGVPVRAEHNQQLRCYAVGALDAARFLGNQVSEVTTHIVQPRVDGISSETLSVEELVAWAENDLAPAAQATLDENAALVPGEAQCRFCPAKGQCPAQAAGVIAHIHGVEDLAHRLSATPDRLDPADIAELLPHAKLAVSWANAVEAHAVALLRGGHEVPGFKLIRGSGRRSWGDGDAVLSALKKTKFKIDEIAPRKVLSPAQAEKLFGKGKLPKAVADQIETSDGNLQLAAASSPEPAVVVDPAAGFTPANI